MRRLTETYFDNKKEQSKIRTALYEAVPVGVCYHNLVVVLSEILQRMVMEMTKEKIFRSKPTLTEEEIKS
jgi:hypothetical protein